MRPLPSLSALRSLPLFSVSLLAALSGCDAGEPIACTTQIVFSVNLTVVDEAGAPLEGASARYRVDGGAEAGCEDLGGGLFACGADEAGAFVITVEAPGREPKTVEAEVGSGECHVEPVALEAMLEPRICGDAIIYGVQASLVGSSGEALEQPVAEWRQAGDRDDAWQSCDRFGEPFSCAPNAWGSLEVRGSAAGHPPVVVSVEVSPDEAQCFPQVEQVEIALEWGAD